MPGALKSHKQPRDETCRVNGARSSWKDLNQFKDTSDTYGVHICTRDDPIYKDYTSTAWTQQKNASPSNCKCLTTQILRSFLSLKCSSGDVYWWSIGCKTQGFNLVLNFTNFWASFCEVCLLSHFVLLSRSLSSTLS